MKIPTIKNLFLALVVLTCGLMIAACSPEKSTSKDDFEKQVEAKAIDGWGHPVVLLEADVTHDA